MNASMSEKIRSQKLKLSKQQQLWGQMILTKQLLQSVQDHLQGRLHMNEPCCFMTRRAQRHNDLPLSQQPCSNHWRSTQVHDGSIPLAWFLQESPSSIAETHGVCNHLAALAELRIYTKENSTKKLKRVYLQALWNYDQILWWCDIMCLLDLISTSELPHTHDNLVQRLKDTKILLYFQAFAMEFAPLWSWANRLSPTLPSGSFMRMIL